MSDEMGMHVVIYGNPPGWNEPGMQPINWAELQTTALDYTSHAQRRIAHLMTSDVVDDPVVDRCYLAAFEAWQRQQTRPETRWEFADRMAKQEDTR